MAYDRLLYAGLNSLSVNPKLRIKRKFTKKRFQTSSVSIDLHFRRFVFKKFYCLALETN